MNKFVCKSNDGVQGTYIREKKKDNFWGIEVDQFEVISCDNLKGNPFILQVKKSDDEVRILYQDNKGEII